MMSKRKKRTVAQHTGYVVEQFVLITVHTGGPDNSCIGKRRLDTLFSLSFRLVEFGGRIV
jgi:hypothetical protein